MCGIDPGELAPFQGGPVYWTVPGVETPGLSPRRPLRGIEPAQRALNLATFGTGQIRDFAEKPALAGLALEGSRLRLPEASRTPKAFGAASSASPSFSPEDGFSAES